MQNAKYFYAVGIFPGHDDMALLGVGVDTVCQFRALAPEGLVAG